MTQEAEKRTDIDHEIRTVQQRKAVIDSFVKARLETIVPTAMRRAGIDMWLVLCNEGVEDPVFSALVPDDPWAVKRLAILIFHDRGHDSLDRILIAHHPVESYVKDSDEDNESQWEALAP